ncbi:hypothetical protein [Actinoplanes utahensis]|uniref:Uncharacterized protein n=1 Tax=Actinoplanes utahensis TaxID=1869 RepID=A0A0A6UM83_ACTUT|nr:hypothetical protein [Actinoplanes utahensis]KHD76546.1 hypothetical protein MB27_16200 [Actinoplanes utahensis]GIF31224.1 hypothetical protein Aut01nite_42100 [Actinoplanes utahensis]
MRLLLALLLLGTALAGMGFLIVPVLIANGPAVLGGLGVLLLVIAAVIPRRKPKCTGHHCAGCSDHS